MKRKIKVIANSLLAVIVALLLVNCTSHPQSKVLNRTNSETRTFRSYLFQRSNHPYVVFLSV